VFGTPVVAHGVARSFRGRGGPAYVTAIVPRQVWSGGGGHQNQRGQRIVLWLIDGKER